MHTGQGPDYQSQMTVSQSSYHQNQIMAATVAAASMPAAAATSDARLQLNAKQQAYKKLVDARSAQASDGHLKLLGQSSLELDLNATPAFQLECLLKVLHSIPSFKAVRIRQSHKSLVKKRTSDAVKPDHSRRSSISNSESDLQKSLVSSLSRNHHLVTLELDSIPSSLVKRIPVMIKGSISTLKHLLLRNLEIEDGSLSKLMQTIASSHIYHLEMVACGLNEACGKELKEIISIHNIRRDVAKWQDKLRDQDNVSNSSSMGLLHIDLSENSLQDSAIRPIIEALVEDKWVKSLQLSSNSLTNSIIGEFIDLLKVNSVLSSVAVENNPGLDRGMMALLQTTLNQRQSGVEATHSTTEFDSYPATKPVRRSSPKKVDLSSTKPPKAVPTSELVRTLDRLFQEQMTSADGLAREQFREILSGVGKLTDTLGKVQDQLKQVLAENLKLKAEVQAFEKKQSEKENLKRKPKKNTLKATGGHDQRICDQDLDDIMEVMEMFESIFTQLHKYMDAVEASKDDHANAPPENDLRDIFDKVQKSAAIFDNVASKLQPRAQQ